MVNIHFQSVFSSRIVWLAKCLMKMLFQLFKIIKYPYYSYFFLFFHSLSPLYPFTQLPSPSVERTSAAPRPRPS
jgi:hypothetical protein